MRWWFFVHFIHTLHQLEWWNSYSFTFFVWNIDNQIFFMCCKWVENKFYAHKQNFFEFNLYFSHKLSSNLADLLFIKEFEIDLYSHCIKLNVEINYTLKWYIQHLKNTNVYHIQVRHILTNLTFSYFHNFFNNSRIFFTKNHIVCHKCHVSSKYLTYLFPKYLV